MANKQRRGNPHPGPPESRMFLPLWAAVLLYLVLLYHLPTTHKNIQIDAIYEIWKELCTRQSSFIYYIPLSKKSSLVITNYLSSLDMCLSWSAFLWLDGMGISHLVRQPRRDQSFLMTFISHSLLRAPGCFTDEALMKLETRAHRRVFLFIFILFFWVSLLKWCVSHHVADGTVRHSLPRACGAYPKFLRPVGLPVTELYC